MSTKLLRKQQGIHAIKVGVRGRLGCSKLWTTSTTTRAKDMKKYLEAELNCPTMLLGCLGYVGREDREKAYAEGVVCKLSLRQ